MILNQINDLQFFTFSTFSNTNLVNHCFSSKNGGVSTGVYSSMNLAFRNDNPNNVFENFKIICNAINCDYQKVVFGNQQHKDFVYKVTAKDIGKGLFFKTDINADAFITNEPEIVLTAFFADCVPIFILDPIKKAIGVVHSGWRGTVLEISKKAILKMIDEYSSDPKDLLVGIGPSINSCCFEVDNYTVNCFKNSLSFSEEFIFTHTKKHKFRIDLQNIIKQSILSTGVLASNIEISDFCTMCNPHIFFSHRLMGNERGSLAAILSLKN